MLLNDDALGFQAKFSEVYYNSKQGTHSSLKTDLSEHQAALGSKFVNILMFLT